MSDDDDEVELLFRLGIGPWCFPTVGKIPDRNGWRTMPAVDEATVRDWRATGYNLAFRAGIKSGLVVIDDDQCKHGGGSYVPPPTHLIAESPTGSRHYYYRAPTPCPGNSANKLAPFVDVRGEGGYIMVPPSVHPVKLYSYRWVETGEPGVFPAFPAEPAPVRVDMTAEPASPGYASAALHREVHAVRTAQDGTRNDTLNKAAFSLGQLVAGGALSSDQVQAELLAAAGVCGLPESESRKTIASGLAGGAKHPRRAPAPTSRSTVTLAAPVETDVLVPGSHILPGGEYVEQGHHEFAGRVLEALPPGALYRRAGVLGEIHEDAFVSIPVHRLRAVVDRHARLTAGKERVKDDGTKEAIVVYRTCSRDFAAVIQEYGQTRGDVRELRYLATYPVCLAPDFAFAKPGWNSGVYLTCPDVPEPLDLPTAKATLSDLVADFPFQSAADEANFIGLLLTPILRPALNEPVPMHLIGSPMERSGKTKLAEIVLGIAISGKRTPAMQLGEREEEREKRIVSVLLRGQSLLHLDNLSDFLDSASLASLLTSSEFQGRLLGQSSAPSIPNGLTVVGTGNNVHATGEIAKRIVPIRLMPQTDSPETRTDFRHPDLFGYVSAERPRILAALLGLIAHWRSDGGPLGRVAFGGFERWAAVTGGIMRACGYDAWMTNANEWRGEADDSGLEYAKLAAAWLDRFGLEWTEAGKVYELAVELDLFGWMSRFSDDRARRTSFGMRVLNKIRNRVVAVNGKRLRVESDSVGKDRKVRLLPV